jgi:capsular polysaccharide biosynthesis protein
MSPACRRACFGGSPTLAEIEAIAVNEALELVRPETLTIAEQIASFSRAEIIVGEF